MMERCRFSVQGVVVDLRGDAEPVRRLAVHFAGFPRSAAPESAITLELRQAKPALEAALPRRLRADQVVPRGVVYNLGRQTWVDHFGRALSCYDYRTEHGTITSEHVADLVELGYLMLNSRLGPHLERRGFVRVHAIGVAHAGRAALVLAPSGGGKSTLALELLRIPALQLLGDDVVLLDVAGNAHSFAMPLGIDAPSRAEGLGRPVPFERRLHPPKWIISLEEGLIERFATVPVPVRLVAQLARVSAAPTQVLELVARRGAVDLWRMAPSMVRRALYCVPLLRQARPVLLEAHDAASAASALLRELAA